MHDISIKMLETVTRKVNTINGEITAIFEKDSSQSGYALHDGIDVEITDEQGNGNGYCIRLYEWEKLYEVTGN